MLPVLSILIITTLLAFYAESRTVVIANDQFGIPWRNERRRINRYLFWGLVTILVCFVGLRTGYNDTYAYKRAFGNLDVGMKALEDMSWTLGANPGFNLSNVLIKTFISENAQVMFFLYALLALIPFFIFYRRWSVKFWLTVYIFTAAGMLLFSMAAQKQILAIAIGLCGITCFLTKKRAWFIALVLLGSTFHPYLIFYFGAFFLGDRVWSRKVTLLIIGAVMSGAFIEYLLQWAQAATALLGEDYTQGGELAGPGMNVLRFAVYSVTPVLTWVYRKQINASRDRALILFSNFTLIGWCFMFIAMFVAANLFARMAAYFDPFMHLTLTTLLIRYVPRKNRRHVLSGCVIGYLLFLAFELYARGFTYHSVLG